VINRVWIIEKIRLQQTSALVIVLQGGEVGRETRKARRIFSAFYDFDTLLFQNDNSSSGAGGPVKITENRSKKSSFFRCTLL